VDDNNPIVIACDRDFLRRAGITPPDELVAIAPFEMLPPLEQEEPEAVASAPMVASVLLLVWLAWAWS
jgi:hypothetical protein